MGVTEFIRRAYYPIFNPIRRKNFKQKSVLKSKKHRGRGLIMGSIADHIITDYVKTGNIRKMASCPAAKRIAYFLKKNRLELVDAHVLICEPSFGIATEIDVLCHANNKLVVIENKTTLQSRAEHEQTYRLADRDNPVLLKGLRTLLNSEYNHHQLQLACMLIMLRNTYKVNATGYILVASSDGLNHYPINPVILNLVATSLCTMHHFAPKSIPVNVGPTISYKFKPFIVSSEQTKYFKPPKLLQTFFKKKFPDSTIFFKHPTGNLTFHERPDVTVKMIADIFIETEKTIFLFSVIPTNLDAKESLLSSEKKLPTGHDSNFQSLAFLNLALTASVLPKKQSKKIELRVMFESSKSSSFLRVVPKSFLSRIS